MRHSVLLTIAMVWLLSYSCAAAEPTASKEQVEFFEKRVRPVLVKHCYECHSADSKELGGKLLLDHRDGILQGGESGPALIAGNAPKSLLVQALRYDGLEMPPEEPLPESVIADFEKWIEQGAADPRTGDNLNKPPVTKAPDLWSLKPRQNPPVPDFKNNEWIQNSIDAFILAKLHDAGLRPTQDAGPRELIRRLYYDLTGLPPSAAEVDEFVSACNRNRTEAVENLVNQLLDSPHFGERWGRHWLDVARYGESNGNDGLGRNPTFPYAWRYRDYVIDAFNEDRPYKQFLTEQIAGDLLPPESPPARDRNLIATGFLAMGAKPAKAMNNNFDMDIVADQIDVIGSGILGLSVACARCHDHKFDPIPARDYYALAGIFTSTETMWGNAANEKLTAPATDLHVLKAAPQAPPPEGFVETVLVLESATGIPKKIPAPKWPVGTPLAMGVRDAKKPADCKVNINGDSKKLGKAVPRAFLSAFGLPSDELIKVDPKQSGRLQLAQWLAHDEHPLTARVMVNRVWQHLFGNGIVRTPDDFGVYGERPSHPELLDHLSNRFVENQWSVKKLVRSIVLSRTYQLSCTPPDHAVELDGENRLLSHHDRRRLDAESLRDSMLAVSGQLNPQPAQGSLVGHRDILVNLAGNLHEPSNHRSVYLCYLRSSPPPELAAFDIPDFTSVAGRRDVSTIPGQALHLLNNPFVIAQAEHFASRIEQSSKNDNERIQNAFRWSLHREPSPDELEASTELIRTTSLELNDDHKAWRNFCQALLITNEFRYVD